MNKTQKKNSKADTIVGFLFLMLLFGGCVRHLGSPWNCDEATAAKETAQDEFEWAIKALVSTPDQDGERWARVKADDLEEAKAKVYRLCKSNR